VEVLTSRSERTGEQCKCKCERGCWRGSWNCRCKFKGWVAGARLRSTRRVEPADGASSAYGCYGRQRDLAPRNAVSKRGRHAGYSVSAAVSCLQPQATTLMCASQAQRLREAFACVVPGTHRQAKRVYHSQVMVQSKDGRV
jgi:hypothetical protein